MPPFGCPSDDVLLAYATGRLPLQESGQWESHMAECDRCMERLVAASDVEDPLLVLLAQGAPIDPHWEEAQCAEFRRRAKQALAGMVPPEPQAGAAVPGRVIPKTLGEYELLEELGRGGMGVVFKARHVKLDKIVALKVLAKERVPDAQAVKRFEREMVAAGAVDHPHVVRAMDAREVSGLPILVTEYVNGWDFSQLVRRAGRMLDADACEVIRQAAEGLEAVHQCGLVHRDIKPSNLILSRDGVVKIVDLGLARWDRPPGPDSGETTSTSQVMGTFDYMAPEQFSSTRGVDIRADIYSLGCTFYRLLAGQPPFRGPGRETPLEKMMAHSTEPIPDIRRVRPDVPDQVAAIIARMMAKSPADRYPTPREVAAAVTPYAQNADLQRVAEKAVQPHAVSATDGASRATGTTRSGRQETPAPERGKAASRGFRQRPRPLVWAAGGMAAVLGLVLGGVVIFVSLRPAVPGSPTSIGWPHECQSLQGANFHPQGSRPRLQDLVFRKQWSRPHAIGPRTADLDGDGGLEVVCVDQVGRPGPLVVLDPSGRELWKRDPVADAQRAESGLLNRGMYDVADLDGDGFAEIVLNVGTETVVKNDDWHDDGPNMLLVYQGDGKLVRTIRLEDGAWGDPLVADVSGDGIAEILVGVADYRGEHGAYVYKVDGTLIGRTLTGEALRVAAVADIDGDGVNEALFHNFASHCEQREVNGVDDLHSHVVAIEGDGNLLWVKRIGTCTAVPAVTDLTGDGKPEIVVFRSQDSVHYPGVNTVLILDSDREYRGPADMEWRGWAIADLDRDGHKEIALGNTDGRLRLLDSKLELVRHRDFPGEVRVQAANDLEGDGTVELVVSSDNLLDVLDSTLETKCHVTFDSQVTDAIVSDVDGDGRNDLLVQTESELWLLRNEGRRAFPPPLQSAQLLVRVETGAEVDVEAIKADVATFPGATVENGWLIFNVPGFTHPWISPDTYTNSGHQPLPSGVQITLCVSVDGIFGCGARADRPGNVLAVFVDTVGGMGGDFPAPFDNGHDFVFRRLPLEKPEQFAHPYTRSDRRQNGLACVIAKAYWLCAEKGYLQGGARDFRQLYDCPWWFRNALDQPVTVLKSCLYCDPNPTTDPISSYICSLWCPAARGGVTENKELSRTLQLSYRNALATCVIGRADNHGTEAAAVLLDGRLVVDEGVPAPSVGRAVLPNARPDTIELLLRKPRKPSCVYVIVAQLGGELAASDLHEQADGREDPPDAWDADPQPMILRLPPGWSTDEDLTDASHTDSGSAERSMRSATPQR